MPTVTCARCGKEFHQKPYKVARAAHHYCSFACRKRTITKVCEWCGKEYQPSGGGKSKDERRFCSHSCTALYGGSTRLNRVILQCAYCGAEIWRHACRLKRNQSFFCSMTCKNAHHAVFIGGEANPRWIGGVVGYRGSDWQTVRGAALKRDAYTCQDCGISETDSLSKYGIPLHVHHIDPYRNEHNNDLDNLKSLCVHCHAVVESTLALAAYHARHHARFEPAS
jgi:hypothetical protein